MSELHPGFPYLCTRCHKHPAKHFVDDDTAYCAACGEGADAAAMRRYESHVEDGAGEVENQ